MKIIDNMKFSTSLLTLTSLFGGIAAKSSRPSHFGSIIQMRSGSSSSNGDEPKFDVISEETVYDGKYRQILQKKVKFPTGKSTSSM